MNTPKRLYFPEKDNCFSYLVTPFLAWTQNFSRPPRISGPLAEYLPENDKSGERNLLKGSTPMSTRDVQSFSIASQPF